MFIETLQFLWRTTVIDNKYVVVLI